MKQKKVNKLDKDIYEIAIIEVGITNKRILKTVEVTKGRKYELLGKELSIMYGGAKVALIPVVLTWDGLVTKYFKKYMETIGISKRIQAYIQNTVIKRTLESRIIDYRNKNEGMAMEEILEQELLKKLLQACRLDQNFDRFQIKWHVGILRSISRMECTF